MIEKEFEEYLICDAELPVTYFTADISELIIQLMHASRLEVHIVVRTKMCLHYGERHTHILYTYTCARAPIHSNDSLCFFLLQADNKDLCTGTPRGELVSS